MEAHGGRIWAESDGPGLGARFTFTVSVVEDAADDWATDPVRLSAVWGRELADGAHVLVVDDDPQIQWYVRNTLSEAGYTPVVTGDPEELDLLIEVEKPDLILLDMKLPGTNKVELMRRMPQITDAPVVFLSGRGEDLDIARAFEMGADDYVVKPFSPTELVATVRASLRRRAASGGTEALEPYCARRPDYQLRRTPREPCEPSGAVDRDRVQAALRAFGQRRPAIDQRSTPAAGMAVERHQGGARLLEAPPQQVRGLRQQPLLHLQ